MQPIYDTAYSLIETYIFGTVEMGTYPDLMCVIGATLICGLAIALPCGVVASVFKYISNLVTRR